MSAIGLIINERSDRSASVIDDILSVARRFSDVRPVVLDGIIGLDTALAEMGQHGVETLIIGGGDGTLQAALTDVINNGRFERPPHYVALPCGMTNVIANDCGLRGQPAQSLDNFLWRHQRGEVNPATRNLMALKNGAAEPIYGFFLGAGAFHSAVEFSRDNVQSRGAKRSLALIASVTGYIWKVATDTDNTVDPVLLDISECGQRDREGEVEQLLFLATTLRQLGSGIYPFWGKEAAPMAVTTIRQPGERLLRAAPAVLRAKSRPWFADKGYYSWNDHHITVRFDGPYVFDGEVFEARADAPLVINTSTCADFLS